MLDVIECCICKDATENLLQMPNCICNVWVVSPKSSPPPRRSPTNIPKGRHSPVPPELDASFLDKYAVTSVNSCFLCHSCTKSYRLKTNEVVEYDYNDSNERNPRFAVKLECPFCRKPYRQRALNVIMKEYDVEVANTHNRIVRIVREEEKRGARKGGKGGGGPGGI